MTASLYMHIPFCSPNAWGGRCDYCDFFSVPVNAANDTNMMDSYISRLLGDIKDQFAMFGVDHVPTVYIGGGTPSALGSERMERLLAGLKALLEPMAAPPAEITVEANPESADEAFMQACVSGGITRISLGVQAFHEPSRQAVRRTGSSSLIEERLALAAEYFPGAFSVDLITGLPYQTIAIVRNDIERALAFRPCHVSLYSLIVEPDTPLGKRVSPLHDGGPNRNGEAALPCADAADSLWIAGRDMLEKAGLAQYEVSNFSLPGKECAHNIRYWRMENWLGAGPSASGTIINDTAGSGRRYTYPADIAAYLDSGPLDSACAEELDKAALIRESLLMGFRYRGGPDPHIFRQRFGCSIEDCIPMAVSRWRGRGFFETGRPGNPAPSRRGMLFLNGFLRDAFAELDSIEHYEHY